MKGVFIPGLEKPTACASDRCLFYLDGDKFSPDYCMIQYAQGVNACNTKLNIHDCPLCNCEASPAEYIGKHAKKGE